MNNIDTIKFNIVAMGIYNFTNQVFLEIKEVKGRFWISAEFRRFEDTFTTYDLIPDESALRQQRWNIPSWFMENGDGCYESNYWDGEKFVKQVFTSEQYHFLKCIVQKYLMVDNPHCLIT